MQYEYHELLSEHGHIQCVYSMRTWTYTVCLQHANMDIYSVFTACEHEFSVWLHILLFIRVHLM